MLTIPTTHASAANRFLLYPSTSLLKLPSSLLSLLNPASLLSRPLVSSILREMTVKKASPSLADESVDSFVRRRFGSFVADSLLSAMVHGIYATDSRLLSVRSAFPFLWEAEQRRGSVVLGLLRGLGKETDVERDEKAREEAAWKHLGAFGESMRTGISVWGLRDGLGTMAQKLEKVLREERGVRFEMGHRIEKVELKGLSGVEVRPSLHKAWVRSNLTGYFRFSTRSPRPSLPSPRRLSSRPSRPVSSTRSSHRLTPSPT